MGVPKRRTSKQKKRQRKAQLRLDPPNVPYSERTRAEGSRSRKYFCANCNQPKPPHAVCPNCGYYRGRPLVAVKR